MGLVIKIVSSSVVIMMAIGSAARLFESEDGDAVVIWTGTL